MTVVMAGETHWSVPEWLQDLARPTRLADEQASRTAISGTLAELEMAVTVFSEALEQLELMVRRFVQTIIETEVRS